MVRQLASRSLALSDLPSLKKKVNKIAKKLGSAELGRVRITMDSTPDTTAVMQNVSFVAQGDDVGTRHGRKIHAEHISLSGVMVKAATSPNTRIRMVLFRDNLGTTTAPTIADIFSSESDFFENRPRLINEQPMKRFTVLWDHYIILGEGFDGEISAKPYKFSKKLNFDILYTGTAATDEGKNSIWYLSGSNEASLVPAQLGDIVFKYSDL